jgi:hypothetical protein
MRKALLAALLCIAAAAPAAADGPMPPAAFRDRLSAAITAITHQTATVVDQRTFRTKAANGTELTLNIDNAYAQYLRDPAQAEAVIARFARIFATPVDTTPSVEQLVVIVRPADYASRAVSPGASMKNFMPPRPMAGDLAFFLAVDAADTIRLAGPDDLKYWRLDEAQAWRRATANIKARVGTIQMIRLGDQSGATGLTAESGLAPSILAEPSFCGPTVPNGVGGQQVLLYARDMFLVASPENPDSVTALWKAARGEAGDEPMSRNVLACRNGRWTVAQR